MADEMFGNCERCGYYFSTLRRVEMPTGEMLVCPDCLSIIRALENLYEIPDEGERKEATR